MPDVPAARTEAAAADTRPGRDVAAVTTPSGGPWPSLGEFLVVPDTSTRDVSIRLVCTLCRPFDAPIPVTSSHPDWGDPTISDVMAAATRHTWAAHRPPSPAYPPM